MFKTMELPPFTDAIRNRLICLLWLTTMAVSLAAHGEQAPEGGYHHRFQNAEQWSRIFDDPKREQWQKPEQVIGQLQLQPGAKVADIGAGTGYFAMRLAKKIPSGIVYTIDVEPDMVKFVDDRARKEGLANIRAVLADADNPKIPEPVDLIFVCDTYHHIGHRSDYFRKLHASLLPGGRIVIVDYYKNKSMPVGPPPEARIDPGQVVKELECAGFRLIRQDDSLDHQYMLFFESRPGNGSTLPKTQAGKP